MPEKVLYEMLGNLKRELIFVDVGTSKYDAILSEVERVVRMIAMLRNNIEPEKEAEKNA